MTYLRTFVMFFLCAGICLKISTGEDDKEPDEEVAQETHQVTKRQCQNAVNSTIHKKCCRTVLYEFHDVYKACSHFLSHHLPEEKPLVYISKYSTCIFERKNFIKSNIELNFRAIKDEAKKLYKKDKKKRYFTTNMFRECGKYATMKMKKMNFKKKSQACANGIEKPFILFVFVCAATYESKVCPYFRWRGKTDWEILDCNEYALQCIKNKFV